MGHRRADIGFFVPVRGLAGLFTLPILLVPKGHVGSAFGFVNTVGQVAAFISPLLVGYTLNATQSNFKLVFHGFVGLFLLGAATSFKIRQPAIG